MFQKDVIIIGAGVTGCSIAYHLAKKGVPSQIVERDSIGARASGKAWAVFPYPPRLLVWEGESADELSAAPKGGIKPWLELAWMSYYRLPDVALELKEKGGINVGYSEIPWIRVALSESEEKDYRHWLSLMAAAGYYESRWLEADDIKAIFPQISPQTRGGIVLPYRQIEPYEYTLGLAQAAEKSGATIRQGEVVDFRKQGSKVTSVIFATGTEIQADVVVIAMGVWSGQGTSLLGKEMPILLNRVQCLRVEVPDRLPPYALQREIEGIVQATIIPKVNGSVIVSRADVDDMPSNFDVTLTTEEEKTAIIDGVVELLPTMQEATVVEHRGDFEGWSPAPNHMQPVLGRLPEWDNVYVASRMGALGMAYSLGVGPVMADFIIGEGHAPESVRNMMEVLSPARL